MKRIMAATPALAALASLFLSSPAGAQVAPEDLAVGAAAARSDAFLRLLENFGQLPARPRGTLGELLARSPKLLAKAEKALWAAPVVRGPTVDNTGVVHVTVELTTRDVAYDIRTKARTLPRSMYADGVAKLSAALDAARAQVGTVSNQTKEWAEADLEADGQASIAGANVPEPEKEKAKRAAMADAYAALFAKTQALKLDEVVTIEAFLRQHPELHPPFSATIIRARLASEGVDRRRTTYQVKLVLPGKTLLEPLRLGKFRLARPEVLTPDQVELARGNAYRAARSELLQNIGSLRSASGKPLAAVLKAQPDLGTQVVALCNRMPMQQVQITEQGLVKVHLAVPTRLLPEQLLGLLMPGTPEQITAVGGGLPKKMKERRRPPAPKPDDPGQ